MVVALVVYCQSDSRLVPLGAGDCRLAAGAELVQLHPGVQRRGHGERQRGDDDLLLDQRPAEQQQQQRQLTGRTPAHWRLSAAPRGLLTGPATEKPRRGPSNPLDDFKRTTNKQTKKKKKQTLYP